MASVAVEEAVTTTGLNVHDGVVYIAGKGLIGITSSIPGAIVKWADLSNLATYTSQAFANDGKHTTSGPCLAYDSGADLCYVAHRSYAAFGGGSNFGIVVSSFDPDDITTISTVADFDTGTPFNPSLSSLTMTGGFLYVLTSPTSLENSRVFKINPSTGAVVANALLSGTAGTRIHGHGIATDGTRLYMSSSTGSNQWAAWMELDLSAHAVLDFGTLSGGGAFSDDITIIGSYFYVNVEQQTTPSGTIKKIAKDLSGSADISIGYLTGVDGQYYDGTSLWVTSNGDLVSGGSQAAALVKIDPSTNAVVTDYGFIGSQTKTNEILPFGTKLVLTTYQTPSVAMRLNTSAVLFPHVAPRVGYFG